MSFAFLGLVSWRVALRASLRLYKYSASELLVLGGEDSFKQWNKFFYGDFIIVANIGVKSMTRNLSQSVRYLPCEHKDLISLDSQSHI